MKTTLCFILTLFTFVTLIFLPNSFAQDSHPIVKLIYFVPRDRQPQPDIDTKFDKLIKDVRRGYQDIMEAHGFGKKTFLFETDGNGNAVVHTVNGQEAEKHYNDEYIINIPAISKEIEEQSFDTKNINLVAIDVSSDHLGGSANICGIAQAYYAHEGGGGFALIPASGPCFSIGVAAHELGHTFGLGHDVRSDARKVPVDTFDERQDFYTSFCAAEWLDISRFFNAEQPTSNEEPTIDMLPPSFVSPPNVIRLRYKITDHDGIHQVQLTTAEIGNTTGYYLLGCIKLNGNTNATVEFVTSSLTPQNEFVRIQMIDVHGNGSWSELYPIDVPSLLPPPEAISIPDLNLAAVVRETLGLAPNSTITQLDMLKIETLNAEKSDKHKTSDLIANLTGLEHATRLKYLYLLNNRIQDITPLAELTNLQRLRLSNNQISDVSSLAKLMNLTELHLEGNPIKDKEPLLKLLERNPEVKIYLKWGGEPLPVTLSHFRAELTDTGIILKWITESEVDNAGFYIYRSETRDRTFKVINPTLIQGAGTTSERNTYTWKDTTAKPNTVYYYRIEDISHAGVREQLATVRMRGFVSASGKLTTRWADLKVKN